MIIKTIVLTIKKKEINNKREKQMDKILTEIVEKMDKDKVFESTGTTCPGNVAELMVFSGRSRNNEAIKKHLYELLSKKDAERIIDDYYVGGINHKKSKFGSHIFSKLYRIIEKKIIVQPSDWVLEGIKD